ncbi:MAG: nucleoside/nucleotide kinase family protein [Acidimicrobiaceae bacterium]|nr:nucleoside/nucleotide kinase family protein [Acidimicrobiaceae bacterium]MBK9972068.1 nucleoside/nucleotide kinase family protein [Acidimicrobiaceae bacterium]MBP9054380.1 nucleoside/nucleotide kinase family protein [Ilumatobacteraceae bacterium]
MTLPTTTQPTPIDPRLIERVDLLLAAGGRLLGIAGAPGAGKSTFAQALLRHYGTRAQVLPMDGFHLANEELVRLGRAHRKGAPDTFDVEGYVATLQRVLSREHDVLAPRFVREIEEPLAGAIRIATTTELVITEGNYLLLQHGQWAQVTALLDEAWMLRPNDDVRRERLVGRHMAHGRSAAEAQDWVRTVDEPNARLVAGSSAPADVLIDPDDPEAWH